MENKKDRTSAKTEKEKQDYFQLIDDPDGRPPLIRRTRGGEPLTKAQIKAIKQGRKKLRKEMKERGIKSKEDFELVAASVGLYIDPLRLFLWLRWFGHGKGLAALLGATAALLGLTMLYSSVTQMRGHFTINMADGMFRDGFVLSETADFKSPTTHLFCEPAVDVPCVSFADLPDNLDQTDGEHHDEYFAYTFYLRNEGEHTVDYDWALQLNSESQNLSQAAWVMVFEDGKMTFYAKPNAEGKEEALPAFDDDSRGYIEPPLRDSCRNPARQYETVASRGPVSYYRVIPELYENEDDVCYGAQKQVAPMEVHKYTVVIWLEGDDPDCTDAMIGGYLGMEMNFRLAGEPLKKQR